MPIGADIPRVDGVDKLEGSTRFVDDLVVPGVLHGGTVRSPVAPAGFGSSETIWWLTES